MPGPATRGIGRTLLPAIEDEESLMNRTLLGPGQVARNVGGSALAGLLGQVGDAARQASVASPIISAMSKGLVSTSPFNQPRVPTTDEAQGLLGVEPERPESMVGLIGAPDVQDIGRLLSMAGGKGLLAMLPAAKVSEGNRVFKTGKPVEFEFSHNTDSATDFFGSPEPGDDFMREFEPSGRYVIHAPGVKPDPSGQFISGKIRFENPLVIPNDNLNWKRRLSEMYDGKTGKELSQALIDDGYDGVVTTDEFRGGQVTSEILDLTTFDPDKAKF